MHPVHSFAAVLLLVPAVLAQDGITWTDGTTLGDVRVTGFDAHEIRYVHKGRGERRPADQVAGLELGRAKEALQSPGASELVEAAKKRAVADPLLAQVCYREAACRLLSSGRFGEAFATLRELVERWPDSGFHAEALRTELEHRLGTDQDQAAALAARWLQLARQKEWATGLVHEAALFELLTREVDSTTSPAVRQELAALRQRTEGAFARVAARARVEIAHRERQEGRAAVARSEYTELADLDSADAVTRAEARLGLGHLLLADGGAAGPEASRAALLSFLRAYLEAPEVAVRLRAEALYQGARAADQWRGEDAAATAARLRSLLRRDFPDSPWARR